MTDQYVLSIDPGKSSGVALLAYNDTEVWLVRGWQFTGGLAGFIRWHETDGTDWVGTQNGPIDYIAEKFTARNTQGFSYTTDSFEPLRIEGMLVYAQYLPDYTPSEKRWRDPKMQYLVGGKDKADKRKRQHKFLKDAGFYVTPKSLGTADADDVRSATAHGLAYLQRELKHRGVHDMVTAWMDENR